MSEVLCRLVSIGNEIGTVTSAMLYDTGFITVDGDTFDGKKFSITMSVKEEEIYAEKLE